MTFTKPIVRYALVTVLVTVMMLLWAWAEEARSQEMGDESTSSVVYEPPPCDLPCLEYVQGVLGWDHIDKMFFQAWVAGHDHVNERYFNEPDWPFWQALGVCETSLNWAHRTANYQGAFGFYSGTWDTWADSRFPAEANWAEPWQQVETGRYGRSVGGYWGCDRAGITF
jgi:hypothetical protein